MYRIDANTSVLKSDMEKQLKSLPNSVRFAGYKAASNYENPNDKAAAAAIAILQEILPEIVVNAIVGNNEGLEQTFQVLTHELRK